MSTTTGASDQGGQIAVDPTDARRLYVSSTRTAAGLWRIDDADTVAPDDARPVLLSGAPGLGALTVQVDGTVLVHRRADAAQDAAVWRVTDPTGPAAGLVRATDGVYAAAAGTVEQLSAAPDGTLYSASTSGGVLVGDPTGTTPDAAPPSTPTGLTATPRDGGGEVVLTWQRAADDVAVTGYEVLRDGEPVAVALTTPTATDRTASPRTTYTYAVRALDAAGRAGELSEPVTVTTTDPPDVTAPDVPTGLHAPATTSTSVALAWDEAADDRATTGYLVYRGDTVVARTDGPAAVEQDLRADTAYAYAVAAVDAAGNTSARSPVVTVRTGPDTVAPAAPPRLAATSPVPYRADLSWAAAPDTGGSGTAGYRVRRAGTDGPPLAVLGPDARGWSDTLVRAGTSYAYSVVAVDGAGNPGPASTATVRTAAAKELRAPSRPTGLRAVSTTAGRTRLAWTASTDNAKVVGYHVYRDGVHVGDATTNAFPDPTTLRRVRYGYTVVAFDTSANVSAASAVLALTAS